mgnify:CR=1 FL=1
MIQSLLPDPDEQAAYFREYRNHLRKSVSILRHRDPDFEAHNDNFQLSQHEFALADSLSIDRDDTTLALGKTWQHLTWEFYIQELAASLPANILKWYLAELYKRNWSPLRLLDVAAAPGGKSAQLASYLLEHDIPWVVRGNDVDSKRLKSWALNIQRSWLYNTVLTKTDGTQFGKLYPELFDAILVDVPCSGEWTWFKSDDAYKWRKESSIHQIAGLQSQILESALHACKVGWYVVYSTCTLNPYENEYQITELLEKYGDQIEILPIDIPHKSPGVVVDDNYKSWHEDKMLRAWPHIHHTGGFFVCLIRKTWSTSWYTTPPTNPAPSLYTYNPWLERRLTKLLRKVYGIELDLTHYALLEAKHHIHIADRDTLDLIKQWCWFLEAGIPLLKKSWRSYSLEHTAWLVLGAQASDNIIDLTSDQLQDYVLGHDISVEDHQVTASNTDDRDQTNKFYFLRYRGLWVWVGKLHQWVIKNKFMKW